jgi:hypothetical protein
MNSNAIGLRRDAAGIGRVPGYGPVLDGLKAFDSINSALRSRQDSIARSAVAAASSFPQPASGRSSTAGSAVAGALAAYASSAAGHEALAKLAGAASGFLRRFLADGGPEQLRLPLEV